MTNDYRARIMPPDVALAEVQSGQRVYIHNGCAEPVELVKALTRRGPELQRCGSASHGDHGDRRLQPARIRRALPSQLAVHRRKCAKAVQEGRADYTPIFLSEIEGLFASGALPIDVCLLQCTPPDQYGYMSLGPSIDASLTAAQCAKHVIVEINDRDAAHAGRHLPAREPRGCVHRDFASAGRVPHACSLGRASRHRATGGAADSRWRDHSDRDRRDSGSGAGAAARPQGPRHPLGNGPRQRSETDSGGGDQRRAQDHPSATK